jgi:hypothetical protein
VIILSLAPNAVLGMIVGIAKTALAPSEVLRNVRRSAECRAMVASLFEAMNVPAGIF